LGRLVRYSFPANFGLGANEALDYEVTRKKFDEITREVYQQTSQIFIFTPEEVALGFLNVANETMSRSMRNATKVRRFGPSAHVLASFGGAGGQHACLIADKLGIERIIIHKHSSILSAVGISQAELQFETSAQFTGTFSKDILPDIEAQIQTLRDKVQNELVAQGTEVESIEYDESLSMRYVGTDTNMAFSTPDDNDYGRKFVETHLREFAFVLGKIVVDSI
jgi:5-oxoprolinase (ATP-hydrolysing)